jgi:hypothetical protein
MCLRVLVAAGLALLCCIPPAAAQNTWERNAQWLEKQFEFCAEEGDREACRFFTARTLSRLFGFSELCDEARCLTSPQLVAELSASADWKQIGVASEQTALTRAREMAVGGLPVVAMQSDRGQVVLVMPGELYPSASWRRKVPMAAGTRTDQPDASVLRKGLNFMFSDPSKVTLYVYK